MRITVLSKIKGLLAAALIAGAVVSCENEKPEFVVPTDHYYPFFIESYIPDTLTVTAGDSVILQFRTYPYNILTKRDSVTIEIKDINDADYEYVRPQLPPKLGKDSIWSLPVHILKGVKNNDAVRLKVTDKLADTVWRSAPIVLHKVRKAIENVTVDTLAFKEGSTATFKVRTTPADLLRKLPKDSITIVDAKGDRCEYAQISSKFLDDGIWELELNIRYPMATGDIIALKVSDPDTVMYSAPVALKIIPKPDLGYLSLDIISDPVCGFMTGGQATVRLRTEPWNLLFDDNNALFITDINGYSSPSISLESQEFQSEDSCWTLKISVPDASVSSFDMRVRIAHPDTVMLSSPVTIVRVAPSMTFVRTGNSQKMDYDSKTRTYSLCLPAVTDFSSQQFLFNFEGDMVSIGDSMLLVGQYNTLDVRKPVTVSVWKYDIHQDYIIKLTNTGLPVVRITTPSPRAMNQFRRDTWSIGAINMRVENADGTVDYEGTISMRGRGNGTWHEPGTKSKDGQTISKRPYAIKLLEEKDKILGMHKHKRWILLANYKDRTLLRNDAAYWLSKHSDFPYTVSGQFVELVWNGVHVGNYYLCEQARIDNHRIDIADPKLDNPLEGGYFMEIDTYLNYSKEDSKWADKGEDQGFWSERFNLPYIFKAPDENADGSLLSKTSLAYTRMYKYVTDMEEAIYNAGPDNHTWQDYLDLDRAVDFALIQEITLNHDAYNTWPHEGPHSAFLYKDSCGKMCFGPVWDFDYHTFMPTCNQNGKDLAKNWVILSTSAKTSSGKYYFEYLLKDDQFKRALVLRWDKYKNTWRNGLPAYIDQMADYIRVSEYYNWEIWGSNKVSDINPNGDQNQDLTLGFQGAVNRMKQGFLDRWDWMDARMNEFRNQLGM